jgi:proline racemase
LFTGWLTEGRDGAIVPHIRGAAFVTGEATLRFDARDPFRFGIGPSASAGSASNPASLRDSAAAPAGA